MTATDDVLIRVENLKQHFPIMRGAILSRQVGAIKAVAGITFSIHRGETLGIVGESGCGKSTTGRSILHLHTPTGGKVFYEDQEISSMSPEMLRRLRPKMQMIFQDSYASLNPRHAIGKIIGEPMRIHGQMGEAEIAERVSNLLEMVGLRPAHRKRFPHEFSGGQRQRINIARALALNPSFIVADEPISALDVSIQAQVVNLMQDLQEELGLTYMFIAHDLSMVRHISHRVGVLYLGKMMELASRDALFSDPLHPYTQSLNAAVPEPDPAKERQRRNFILKGDPPSPANPPSGCVFHTRCPLTVEECVMKVPEFREIRPGHFVACHLANEAGSSKIPAETILASELV